MYSELTQEQIVTRLLTSQEIINTTNENQYISKVVHDLGDYLKNLPEPIEEVVEETSAKNSRYTFIKL